MAVVSVTIREVGGRGRAEIAKETNVFSFLTVRNVNNNNNIGKSA